jgi:hypothetical protein
LAITGKPCQWPKFRHYVGKHTINLSVFFGVIAALYVRYRTNGRFSNRL